MTESLFWRSFRYVVDFFNMKNGSISQSYRYVSTTTIDVVYRCSKCIVKVMKLVWNFEMLVNDAYNNLWSIPVDDVCDRNGRICNQHILSPTKSLASVFSLSFSCEGTVVSFKRILTAKLYSVILWINAFWIEMLPLGCPDCYFFARTCR